MGDWQPGSFEILCRSGIKEIVGYLDPPFALDWGIYEDVDGDICLAWVIHHLPTGYRVMAIDGKADEAVRAVEILRKLGDWQFTDLKEIASYRTAKIDVEAAGISILDGARVKRPDAPTRREAVNA